VIGLRKKMLPCTIFRFFGGVNGSGFRSDVPQPLTAVCVMMTFILWRFLKEYIRTVCENEKRLSLYIKLLSSGEAKFHAL
jgi:hypothetical protein